MSETSGFFDAEIVDGAYDRTYNSSNFAEYFSSFVGNGVFADKFNELQVTQQDTPNVGVKVLPGLGWINGYWYKNSEAMNLSLDAPDSALNRIDTIVLRLGYVSKTISIEIKKGMLASSPVAPTLQRDGTYYELQIASIYIEASTTSILNSKITDTRPNKTKCGWVTGVIDQIDYEGIMSQYESAFDEWFDEMKNQLSTDAAGNLQNQITNHLADESNPHSVTKAQVGLGNVPNIIPSAVFSEVLTPTKIGSYLYVFNLVKEADLVIVYGYNNSLKSSYGFDVVPDKDSNDVSQKYDWRSMSPVMLPRQIATSFKDMPGWNEWQTAYTEGLIAFSGGPALSPSDTYTQNNGKTIRIYDDALNWSVMTLRVVGIKF